jgi:hypothetical protein
LWKNHLEFGYLIEQLKLAIMAYKDYIKDFFSQARKSEKTLKQMLEEAKKKAERVNVRQRGLTDYDTIMRWHEDETCDQYTNPQAIKKDRQGTVIVHGTEEQYPLKVWLSNVWMGSNKIPESVKDKVIDGRYPIRVASMWYTPHTHFTRWSDKQLTLDEFYKKAEKEKVLFFNFEVKISMVRRNAIPNKHSCQWKHKMSEPEYVMYLRDQKKLPAKQQKRIEELNDLIHTARLNNENINNLREERAKLMRKAYYWREVLNAETLNKLETKARQVFNDWYDY